MIWEQIPQFIVSGLTSGSIYALVALGFCLIENATGVVNVAQGEFLMLGAMIMISLYEGLGLPAVPAFALAVAAVALIGVLYYEGPIRRSKNRDILTLVLITIGAAIVMKGSAMLVWGKSARILPAWGGDRPILFLNAAVLPQTLWILGITLGVLAVLYVFYRRTLLGKAMRAVADNPEGAVLIGISVRKLVTLAFALSGALGATAGILITPLTSMSYNAGLMMGLKGFAAAILGGFGSIGGAVAGGLLLGIFESLGAGFISSTYKDAIAFVILLAILFVRPAGLFGSSRVRRL
jgi:branched-chain amino acid transport system permease protein